MKRMNPEYRRLEQERDRDRKKARRSNEAFRQLEKFRDKIRKERKKGIIVDEAALAQQFNIVTPATSIEPEVIISDPMATDANISQPQVDHQPLETHTQPQASQTQMQSQTRHENQQTSHQLQPTSPSAMALDNQRRRMPNVLHNLGGGVSGSAGLAAGISSANLTAVTTAAANSTVSANHMPQLNKGFLYPSPNFPRHPLPIPALMPPLCHPMLHQNLNATLYSQNGIKQEYIENNGHNNHHHLAAAAAAAANALGNISDEHDMPLIEPEIILQTSSEILSAPHAHFNNHAHAHVQHLHHQQPHNMFQHMTQPAHMSAHMRAALPPTQLTNDGQSTTAAVHNTMPRQPQPQTQTQSQQQPSQH